MGGPPPALTTVTVGDARLEVLDEGSGAPVVLIQTALTADELLPLAARLRDRYRTITYHRRGYCGSSPTTGPGSISRDATDCRALLDVLQVSRAHVVGLSYSSAVAMQLAAHDPAYVRSLTLLEPPPVHVPSAPEFRAANERLFAARRTRGPEAALKEFLALVVGPDWRTDMERQLPGSAEQTRRDAGTFFDSDLPALLAWQFSAKDASRITCPVLHVGGTDSGPWFAAVRRLILDWLPDAEDVVIDGADHSLALTHTDQVAAAVDSFLRSAVTVADQEGRLILGQERVFDAPRERVFEAVTVPTELAEWWGPHGFTTPDIQLDLRVGGTYRFTMQPPDGEAFHLSGEFLEVDPPDRLSFTFRWDEPDPDDRETVVVLSLRSVDGATSVSLSQGEFATEGRLELHRQGWADSFEKLDVLLRTRAS